MQYKRIGNSDLLVSEIGFGCMSLSSPDLVGSVQLIHEAQESGINYFDTADLYDRGDNEVLLGKALKEKRKSCVIATKVGNQWVEGQEGWTWNPTKKYILESIDRSLQRLQTDYVDLYQLHGGTIDDNFDEVVETFERLVELGKIRYYGISSIRPNVFTKYLDGSNLISNMMQYSILDNRPEEYFPHFRENNVSVLVRGSLAQGLLLDKKIEKAYLGYTPQELLALRDQIALMADRFEVSGQAIALKYCLDNPVVASVSVGIRTPRQLEALFGAYQEAKLLSVYDFTDRMDLIRRISYTEHRN